MPELHRFGLFSLVFLIGIAAGCGGAATRTTAAPAVSAQAEVVGDPTDGGRRRAHEGAQCDYGGNADLTCRRGLYCCYGPPENPGTFGQCMAECPE